MSLRRTPRRAARGGPANRALTGVTYVTASAGNHGLSLAAGARLFGANAVVYIAETVAEGFARRLRAKGAAVRREGSDYEASNRAAIAAATREGLVLLSDSSFPGYTDIPHRVMQGYLALMVEAAAQMPAQPGHVFVQAGVGGLADAVAAFTRARWGAAPRVNVVEPQAAPALQASIRAGRAVIAAGPVSAMGRPDCKEPSLIALRGLARDADFFATITEHEATAVLPLLTAEGLATTPSGGAGLAALLASAPHRAALGLGAGSRIFAVLSEGPEPVG